MGLLLRAILPLLAISGAAQSYVEANCSSSGLCASTAGACVYDDVQECFPLSGVRRRPYFSFTPSGSQSYTGSCSVSSGSPADIELKNLTVEYLPNNPRYVDVCLSWVLAETNSSVKGYNVQLLQAYRRPLVFCIEDSNQTSVCLKNLDYETLQYNHMEVKVRPFPLSGDISEEQLTLTQTLRSDLRGCADLEENEDWRCVGRYGKPRNLTVTSTVSKNGSKKLKVSWSHVPNMPVPDSYFFQLKQLKDARRKSLGADFMVSNATEVTLSNLKADLTYEVRVQAYSRCSGLGRRNFNPYRLGCGRGTTALEEPQDGYSELEEETEEPVTQKNF